MAPHQRLRLLAALCVLSLLLSILWWGESDEEEIQDLLRSIARASQDTTKSSVATLRKNVAPRVALTVNNDSQPPLSQDEALALWFGFLTTNAPLYIELPDIKVTIAGDQARAEGQALVSQSQHGDLHARMVPFDVNLRRRDNRWYVDALRLEEGAPLLPEARP